MIKAIKSKTAGLVELRHENGKHIYDMTKGEAKELAKELVGASK